MKQSLKDFVEKVVVYYSRSKGDIVIGYCKSIVKSPITHEKALLIEDYVSGKEIVLRKTPKILTLEMYELQNKLKFRMYFLLKMLGYHEVSNDVIHQDKTINELVGDQHVAALSLRLHGAKDSKRIYETMTMEYPNGTEKNA